jgi:hypothetical protein
LDVPWHSNGKYIESQNAFIFSLTSNIKCPITKAQNAAYGGTAYGPTFGYGCDICVQMYGKDKGYIKPSSYTGTAQLGLRKKDSENGTIYFTTVSVDVYTID